MFKVAKLTKEGFTIVETLIVLAIAALIITIVLIAVPDLQRSARNTDIKSDATNVATAVQSFESNDGGTLPTVANGDFVTPWNAGTAVGTGGKVTIGTSTDTIATATVQSSDKINAIDGSTAAPTYSTTQQGASTTAVGPGNILVDTGVDCAATTKAGKTTQTADARAVAIFYPVEANGTGTVSCIQE